jgi:hypothetical protein
MSFFVGLQGARVPFPFIINAEIVMTMKYNPKNMIQMPTINVGMLFIRMSFSSDKGTNTRTVKGRMKEKICLIIFFIL